MSDGKRSAPKLDDMSMTQIQLELSTPEGFARSVAHKRGAVSLAWTLLVLGGVGLAWNLFNTFTAVQATSMRFFGVVFFSARSSRADFDPMVAVYVWGPFLAIPLAIILLAYAGATATKAKHALFERFQQRGYIARQEELGLSLKIAGERSTESLTALSSPELGEERFTYEVEALRAALANTPPKELKPVTKKLAKTELRGSGIEANTIFSAAPEGFVLSTKRPGEHLVVVRPEPGKSNAKRVILALKA